MTSCPGPGVVHDDGDVQGLLLAAGAGRRAGGPKALRRDPDGTSWLLRSIGVLLDGGCATVVVVLGCSAELARTLVTGSSLGSDPRVRTVEAVNWQLGLSASLRSGLRAVPPQSRAALVHLVDLPDVGAPVVRRLSQRPGRNVLARAVYGARPGHPVLIGSNHLAAVTDGLAGDRGAGGFLATQEVEAVECGDLASGRDQDE